MAKKSRKKGNAKLAKIKFKKPLGHTTVSGRLKEELKRFRAAKRKRLLSAGTGTGGRYSGPTIRRPG